VTEFGMMWVGDSLTKIQEVSISSFIYHGHDVSIFVYDKDLDVPSGAKKMDANEIIPESEIFKVKNTYAAFSDVFRYQMINKTGLPWVDADTICVSDDWNFKDNIFAGYEAEIVVGGVLSLPKDSPAIKYMIEKSSSFDKEKISWVEVGPSLVNETFRKFNLMKYVYSEETFCGIHYSEWKKLWNPRNLKEIKELEEKAHSISAYNSMATFAKINKNVLPRGSAMEYFYRKFVK
jgi:hypothetical protein